MEKFIVTPLKNSENEPGRTLLERNSPTTAKEEEEMSKEKPVEKKSSLQVLDKSVKQKKLKLKKGRGEKRKFPDKMESVKKIKRKKKEEKSLGTAISQNLSESRVSEDQEIEILKVVAVTHPELQCKRTAENKDSSVVENDSDVENGEKIVKPKSSRKNKTIASACKHTLDVLLKFDLEALTLLDKSLKIVKSHSLLDNKYISVDVLLDLIALALEKNGPSDVDSEKELSFIIAKCTGGLFTTPKRSKTGHSIPTSVSPKNKCELQEELPVMTPTPNKEVLNQSQDLEVTEKSEDAIAGLPEKSQEPTVEKSGKNFCITNYFKKLKKTVDERDKNERFSCFTAKTDMFLAPKVGGELKGERRETFEQAFIAQNCVSHYLAELFRRPRPSKVSPASISTEDGSVASRENSEELRAPTSGTSCADGMETSDIAKPDSATRKRVTLTRVNGPKSEPADAMCRAKAKLFQFHDNRRPPYWGTWRRKSDSVGSRRPFGKDKMFNYEIDSDDEWEEEEEPGESLHGSEDEKEPEEDYEVDNDFFVPHGYLSDDENPENDENSTSKAKLNLLEEQFTSEQKRKMRKMTPTVFGIFWVHKDLPFEGTLHQDLQIERLQYVAWTSIPVEIEEEPTSTVKKSKQKTFPNEEIPNLIKMIHGSPQNCDHLVRKFLLYWETERIPDGNRPGLTKICVQKKIKELAAWQASHEKGKMCWQVPRETREEFGAEVDNKTPEKKPRKCFIWKFVRKAEKATAVENPSPPAPPSNLTS